MAADARLLRLPRLHVVTHSGVLERADFASAAAGVLEAGGPSVALHLRGPGTGGGRIHALASELLEVARATGARLLVNDRVDVALTVPVDGVHLGGHSLAASVVRSLMGPGPWIGVSVHGASELTAAAIGANYVFAGTVYPTPSHEGRPGFGASGLGAVVAAAGALPVIGIGGVAAAKVDEVLRSGAYGVAVVRGVWDAADPVAAVTGYLEGLAAASAPWSPTDAADAPPGAAGQRLRDP